MPVAAPHFLLMADRGASRNWHFVLQAEAGANRLAAGDEEPDVGQERLELLAVVRGLESLDQPSHVTLVTSSRYVYRGLRYGLDEWRTNDWRWERHGRMVPVKNCDLWRRIDRAMRFHDVQCRPKTGSQSMNQELGYPENASNAQNSRLAAS